jgi:hypothetical protein
MISFWRADTKDILPADTTNVFCSSAAAHRSEGNAAASPPRPATSAGRARSDASSGAGRDCLARVHRRSRERPAAALMLQWWHRVCGRRRPSRADARWHARTLDRKMDGSGRALLSRRTYLEARLLIAAREHVAIMPSTWTVGEACFRDGGCRSQPDLRGRDLAAMVS